MARRVTDDPYRAYSGDLVAGLTPTQKRGISNINKAQGMALPAIQTGMQYTRQAAMGVTPKLYKQYYSPYVKNVAKTTMANLMESQGQQQSALKAGAIQGGAFGGDRSGVALAEMARQQQLGNAMAMSNIYNQGYGQAMDLAGRQVANLGAMGQQMAGLGAAAQGSVLQGAQAQMAAGAQQQATQQAELQARYEQWMQKRAYPYQNAQFFANIAQGLGAGAGGSSSTTAPSPNLFSQILGGIGAIGSIASDKRLKENIEAVGKLNDGQTIYRYNFKGDPKTQIGLLAQEVEHTKPGAVTQTKGLKMVNYKSATDDAAEMSHAGGSVYPAGDRQGLAAGGIPFYPYGDAVAYVPEGKISGREDTIGYRAPKAYEDAGLAEEWKNLNPIDAESAAGLRSLAAKVGIEFPSTSQGVYSAGGLVGMANGGTAARTNYAEGGVGEAEYPMAEEVPYDVPTGLIASESGGDFGAQNDQGYVGRLQFGPARLEDAKRAGVIPPDMTPEEFRTNPEAQKATERWHFGDINDFIDKTGLGSVEGSKINGVPITREGLVSVAHLGGKGGLQKFVASGGKYDPADANGTRLSDYLALAANTGVAGGEAPETMAPSTGVVASADMPDPNAPVESGYVIKGEKPGLKFDMKKLFASEDNPSVIERIMGRRLSPEARSAVLNASFALMAGRSPFFFTNLGEAGKVGTQTYYNALSQGRELSKQQAEIGLTQQERDIQRTNAATARINAARQLYAQMLPQIKFWQMRNPGKPLPPEYRRVIDAAYPVEGPAGLTQAPGLTPELSGPATGASEAAAPSAPSVTSGATAPVPPAGKMPPADGSEAVNAPPSSGNSDLDKLYAQLPNEMNPNYWNSMAQNAMTSEDYSRASQRAAELTQQYQENGIPLPSGVVPFPGKMEMQTQQDLRKLQTEGAYKATADKTEKAQNTIESYQTTNNTLSQAASKLASTDTGQLEDTKTYIVTALDSLGLSNDADRLEQATGVQELRKIFSQILFSGGLKDKIGSNVAARELEMFSQGFGDVNLEPAVNRFIVGTMRGILEMENKRAQDWIAFVDENGDKPLSRRQITSWEIDWNKNPENKISNFVEQSIANTPVKGELDFSNPRSRAQAKAGYKYVMPDGKIAVYNGTDFELED